MGEEADRLQRVRWADRLRAEGKADWLDDDNDDDDVEPRRREGAAALISLARRCPRLSRLRFKTFDFGSASPDEIDVLLRPFGTLDALRELDLYDVDQSDARALLSKTPNLVALSISALDLYSALPLPLPSLRRLAVGTLAARADLPAFH